jgi:uncharacterized protein
MLYVDSSALVKLVQRDAESAALRRYLRRYRQDRLATSMLARVEVVRAVAAGGAGAVAKARLQLSRVHQVVLSRAVLDEAAVLVPAGGLRTLDAIHLAAARALGPELRAVVTYDHRMAEAAQSLALPVDAPV